MSGSGDPPEGTPDGAPGGGDDEYRSVVFDESFVRAARIQEYSARERLDGGAARAVRVRHVLPRGLARQAVALILLIVVAFGFAVYMGVRHPYRADTPAAGQQLQTDVIPLVPTGPVPAVSATSPFAGSSAEHYRIGAEGINADGARRIGGFSESEVDQAYTTAKEYLTDSSLDPRTVLNGDVGAVRNLLDPGQLDQFDSSLSRPAADGLHEATGWLVRFDPAAKVRLVTDEIRVQGTLQAAETSDNRLEIVADHTFVYAVRGPAPDDEVSLFTVRRQLHFRFDHQDLQQHHIEIVQADVAAGPLACATPLQGFRPILAGHTAPGAVSGADPYNHDRPVGAVCAPLGGGDNGKGGSAGRMAPTTSPASGATGGTGGTTASAASVAAQSFRVDVRAHS
jgi:hypothetical protein